MSNLWVSLKRDKILADVYYKGEKILTLNISEQNRGNTAIILMQDCKDIKFKIINNNKSQYIEDGSIFNKECFNKSVDVVDLV